MSRAAPAGAQAALDWLATMVALVDPQGRMLHANPAMEAGLGLSRRHLLGRDLAQWLTRQSLWHEALQQVQANEFSSKRFDCTVMARTAADPLQVQLIVARTELPDTLLVELVELGQQTRQEREEQWLNQAQANKDLIRNLAHEIKNPLGGIRGAAQLLQMDLESRELQEYTRIIIHEVDRLQTLVDSLLAPHRRPHVVGEMNIHEVLERVRSVILAEFPQGLSVERDYDASIPEFRGDREQLIQAILNIVHNAALVLSERRRAGDARIVLKTRIARQVTLAKQRHRLALLLHITDNGPGVPADIKDRMFFPLVSGREGGSGLGLTLAQTFIQQHQGTIECDSQPGLTDFRILMPLP
ncbi:nitrogen regulation protein NR(II) [Thiomonas sp. X19]|uniref:nitrogen regulation protein NR(II) n=1 Tax=Thiomonas sp. X19 TaxID=1050370 RepID=UPI000DDB6978|nr:nitrogen regulation protein NR(II) [Thiomonas sp. X19]